MMIALALVAASLAGRFEFRELHMGVEVRIVLHAEDASQAAAAARVAFDRVRAWDDALSDWREGTPAQRLPSTAGSSMIVDGRLAAALDASRRLGAVTDGGFDAALGSLTRLWREARRTRVMPTDSQIDRARDAAGAGAWAWDPPERRFTALRDGVRMDFGAIAQGLAADDALASLRTAGLPSALVDVSGDIAVGAPPPGADGWRIGIAPHVDGAPEEQLLLRDCAISTSGDRVQRIRIGDVEVGHLLDPRNGRPLPALRQATVLADTAATADAVATALCTLPMQEARRVADRLALAARIDRAPAEGGVVTTGAWRTIRRASSDPADAPSAPEAPRPSPATPASGPPDSPARPST
jgi:thiamine biosynthesis lipoprotein